MRGRGINLEFFFNEFLELVLKRLGHELVLVRLGLELVLKRLGYGHVLKRLSGLCFVLIGRLLHKFLDFFLQRLAPPVLENLHLFVDFIAHLPKRVDPTSSAEGQSAAKGIPWVRRPCARYRRSQ